MTHTISPVFHRGVLYGFYQAGEAHTVENVGDPTELMPFSSVASYPMFAGCVSLVIRPERGRKGPLELEVSAEGLGKARAIVRP